DYPLDSDDGISYFQIAEEIARTPQRIWTQPPIEANMFSLYVVFMGLWFRMVGAQIPSWLVWQGVAAGLLAVMVYHLGQRVSGSRLVGMVAAAMVMLDHVMLHLMATLNLEVAFIPALYVAVWLWSTVPDQPPRAQRRRCFLAGCAVGLSALFRPTSGLLPVALVGASCLERPKLPWRSLVQHTSWMLAGFALPIALLLIRHRLAWGYWTFGGSSSAPASWSANYAWNIQNQHPSQIGWGPWFQLLASDPAVIWREMIPNWWAQILNLWTHRGFGQMDLVQGLNYPGFYQAALSVIIAVCVIVGVATALRRRSRADLTLLMLPAYFTGLALVFWVINTR
ncbi:MAG: glycosyltransferase family 39 protein, partial [Planctomycetota bacterium]